MVLHFDTISHWLGAYTEWSLVPCNEHLRYINSLRPSVSMWHPEYWWALVQLMSHCLLALNHYLNQCLLIINVGPLNQGNFISNIEEIVHSSRRQGRITVMCLCSMSIIGSDNQSGTKPKLVTFYSYQIWQPFNFLLPKLVVLQFFCFTKLEGSGWPQGLLERRLCL